MPQLLLLLTLAAAVDAPVTEVTVFSDRARVVRTATVATSGAQAVELPPLPQSVDPSSIRVEATGAEVKRVELTRLEDDELPVDEAKLLISALQAADDELAKLNAESTAVRKQTDSLQRIAPGVPAADPLKPPAKLNPAGWTAAIAFVTDSLAKSQARQRELALKLQTAVEKRRELVSKAALLGATQRRYGWKVVAQLGGGAPSLKLTYFVLRARWYPLYDLALNSDTGKVTVAFSGLVSQESGEDWNDAAVTLSTAVPATVTTLPKLLTWKIGEKERFIPTPTRVSDSARPPPTVPALPVQEREQDLLRGKLQQIAGGRGPGGPTGAYDKKKSGKREDFAFSGDELDGEFAPEELAETDAVGRGAMRDQPMPPPPPPAPPRSATRSMAPGSMEEPMREVTAEAKSSGRRKSDDAPAPPTFGFSLAPPPGYRAPAFSGDLPNAAAGGFELAYTSLQKETVQSGKGARKVALFTEAWPVTVERKMFPALFPEAFLVAELKNPSPQPLPAGNANLYVGDDPAGNARLSLVAPGEAFTLPLGIDRALRPVRNVKVLQSERGVISKDEVTDYVVTIELANPYRSAVAVRLLDQIPITTQKDVEILLFESKPLATQDKRTGSLEWRLSVPPAAKTVVSFSYSIKRPKGWLLQQTEVRP